MESHLDGLNPKQREAATHINGPLLIVAGAGAGKTKTITHRILNLIKNGVAPEKILAVTFTNKAAKEMRERINYELRINNYELNEATPFVSTFHSLGVYIIKENARVLGLTRHFTILDESDSNTLIKESIKEIGLDPKQYDPKKIGNIISREKGKFTHLADYAENATDYLGKIVAQVWSLYEKKKAKENSLDFDDLLLKATKLLKENEQIRKIYQEKWDYIHIDEYQDTNEVQYLMSRLLSANNKNICVVGDMDQCLVKGTKIKMANNTLKPIENIKKGDFILSNYGSGDFRPAIVLKKRNLQFKGNLIKIETESGKIITSTPDHIHFAGYRLGITPQIFLNYLMYKKDFGWRIGTTSIYTNGRKKSVVGFIQRSNQEHADAVWVIATHKTQNEARIQEYIFSLKYRIPTIPFTPRKGLSINGYVHDKIALKKIFSFFNTENSALKLLSDIGLSQNYPHHYPQNHNSSRRNINITLCADKRGKNPMHLVSTFGNDIIGRKKLESIGFSVRLAKKNTKNWRFETVYADYEKACLSATKIASIFPEVNLIFRARLGGKKNNPKDGNSLPCLPASSIIPGMVFFTENNYDVVSKVSKIFTSKIKVFDLDIEKTHNFIANGIVTHNCIYSWRGANLKNILSFEKDYGKDVKIILLEENYRSTQNILEAANEIIKKNKYRPDKNLFTKNKVGEKIGFYEALDENDEAEFVATKILEILDKTSDSSFLGSLSGCAHGALTLGSSACESPKKEKSDILSNIAILYRANFQSRALEEAMLRYNIPYQVLGVKFFERKEIKDTLAYLRSALNPESLSDIKRIINFPARGIGKATLIKLFAGEKENLPVKMQIKIDNFYKTLEAIKEKIKTSKASEVIKFTIKKSGIETELLASGEEDLERLENIKELATLALKYDELKNGEGVEKLLEDASLASDQDSIMLNEEKKKEINAVKLMTVHASKGLEFKYVFITGLEDGLFPHQRDGETKNAEDKEEERRLFYVALTRAKEKLFLSFANFRTIFGSRQINTPSEFIADIPRDLLEKEGEESGIKTIYL
ncbi:MAG: UvrD-helicase domain-containing protein [Candidatus Paceibacterota bacterium]|jgi:DNA helicase-2/ATP-dependent DNA helicase PcrA